MEDILTSMKIMEEEQIHHRDMKPENIYLYTNEKGEVRAKIGDFGSAHEVYDEKQDLSLVGTPPYVAPYLYKADAFLKEHKEKRDMNAFANYYLDPIEKRLEESKKDLEAASNDNQRIEDLNKRIELAQKEKQFIEACRDDEDYCKKTLASTKSDLFAVGLILHEICTGRDKLLVYENAKASAARNVKSSDLNAKVKAEKAAIFRKSIFVSHEEFFDDPFFKDPDQMTPISGFVEELMNFNQDDCPTAEECLKKFKEITGSPGK